MFNIMFGLRVRVRMLVFVTIRVYSLGFRGSGLQVGLGFGVLGVGGSGGL